MSWTSISVHSLARAALATLVAVACGGCIFLGPKCRHRSHAACHPLCCSHPCGCKQHGAAHAPKGPVALLPGFAPGPRHAATPGTPPAGDPGDAIFTERDSNQDGVLTPDEAPGLGQRIPGVDADGSGAVSREELRTAREQGRQPGGEHRREFAAQRTERPLDRRREALDSNQDRRVLHEEWERIAERFAELDGNSDGFLTREEIRGGLPKLHERMRALEPPPDAPPPPPPDGNQPPKEKRA